MATGHEHHVDINLRIIIHRLKEDMTRRSNMGIMETSPITTLIRKEPRHHHVVMSATIKVIMPAMPKCRPDTHRTNVTWPLLVALAEGTMVVLHLHKRWLHRWGPMGIP
mmetsp:Transcript_49123/g.68277  ORF Transcript_49123/g.68277 Transcript_49123/m.68277 type:complete len:109 (+) Transcript_49123:115-441(+)